MAKRAMIYCPRCRHVGLPTVELVTENPEPDVFRCPNSHAFTSYLELMKMNPDMIKVVAHETPQPNQEKVEVWVDRGVVSKFREQFPAKLNSTVESIMTLALLGDYIIIDGVQAKKIRALGVKNGAEMVAALEVGKGLEGELETTRAQLSMIQGMLQAAGVHVGG